MSGKKERIAFIVQLPKGVSPSQRFRVEAWEDALHEVGYCTHTFPFWSMAGRRILYAKGHTLARAGHLLIGYVRRLLLMPRLLGYDWVFIQREAAPLGPPIFEWIIAKVLRRRIIYDYDDAIWLPMPGSLLQRWLKAAWKVASICKWSHTVVGGNDYLCEYARQHSGARVVYIPTVVDTDKVYRPQKIHSAKRVPVVGWTGSHSTLPYLRIATSILERLFEKVEFSLLIIADQPPDFSLPNIQFVRWNTSTEIDDLLHMDVGIMPLPDDEWAKGKCGFKLIQYMALGVPAVASAVGVNGKIISDGENGFLASNEREWEVALYKLLTSAASREKMGARSRQKIVNDYSIVSFKEKFVQMFEGKP